MSLIQPPAAPVTDPSLLTAQALRGGVTRLFTQDKMAVNQLYTMIFKNPYKLTAQQAFTALGTDAGQAHTLYLAISGLLNSVAPGTCPAVPNLITINADGTVTVGALVHTAS